MTTLNLANRRPLPLYERIRGELRRQIVTGQLLEGARLATERQLADQFGVSVLTVRQAQDGLIGEGLIAKHQGRGTFVTAAAATRRRVLLVCGLVQEHGAPPSPYFLHSMRYCQEAATAAGLPISTVWLENHPPHPDDAGAEEDRLARHAAFIFLGCNDFHQTLRAVRVKHRLHVNLGKAQPDPAAVWFDPREAAALALQALRSQGQAAPKRLIVVGTEGTRTGMLALTGASQVGLQSLFIPPCQGAWEYERAAYILVRHLPAADLADAGFIFLDDMVARGGTRALLEAGTSGGASTIATPRVAVVCGRQEIFPYGMPVHFVVHDTAREAQLAVAMIVAGLAGKSQPSCQQSHYRLILADQLDNEQLTQLSPLMLQVVPS
jgi:DNA-binding LacI/PurR family transcriptional regulator